MASSSSAVQPVQQQARRSGKKTVEYERTKACMTNFTKTITVIGAVPSLRRQFVQATWLGIEADSTADQLFAQALIRIENDASQFTVFCDMLGEIKGADQILDNLKGVYMYIIQLCTCIIMILAMKIWDLCSC